MIALRNRFARYVADDGGAYAVMFAMTLGFLVMAAHVGIDALRVQNSGTAAEQLVDISCQKIAQADPALYPSAASLKAGVEAQMEKRRVAGADKTDGTITVDAIGPDPAYVPLLQVGGVDNPNNADLRRYKFNVTYQGSVKKLHRDIAQKGNVGVQIVKTCKQVCTGMTNVIYSNEGAIGHWFDNYNIRAAQRIDTKGNNVEPFTDIVFSDGKNRTFTTGDRIVMTIMTTADDGTDRIRIREVLTMPVSFFIDNNNGSAQGQPRKDVKRYVAYDGDSLVLQALNVDGSLPGFCGPQQMPTCAGANCGGTVAGCTGACTDPVTPEPIDKVCSGITAADVKTRDEVYTVAPGINVMVNRVEFSFPQDGHVGQVRLVWPTYDAVLKLAPFYVRNAVKKHVRFANSVFKDVTMEELFTLSHMKNNYWRRLVPSDQFPDHRYVIHFSSYNLTWFWDGQKDCFLFGSPIVFDTENLGNIQTTRTEKKPEQEPMFDVYGHGHKLRVEWPIGRGQAWLVDNRDGRAAQDMNGQRFFGAFGAESNGYDKLAEWDRSGTGVLRGRDLEGLALWFDNGNGIVEESELQSVIAAGVTSIDTRATRETLPDGREVVRSKAEMNGRTIMTEDIFVRLTTPLTDEVLARLRPQEANP